MNLLLQVDKSQLNYPNRVQTPESEEAIQRVLQQIMFQNSTMPQKGSTTSQARHRALTVGERSSNSSAYLFRNSRKGDIYHIPRFQKDIIMRELLTSKQKQQHAIHAPNLQNEAKAMMNHQPNGLKMAANRPPKTSKKQKNSKNVIVRRIKSGGGNMAHQASRTVGAGQNGGNGMNGHHFLRKQESQDTADAQNDSQPMHFQDLNGQKQPNSGINHTSGVSKNANNIKNGSNHQMARRGAPYEDHDTFQDQGARSEQIQGEGSDTLRDGKGCELMANSIGLGNHYNNGQEIHQKFFDLRQARAMFMPHKMPKKEGVESVDSQEELRNLTGNEIWELTQKAALYEQQRNAQFRQQYVEQMTQQYENELGFGQAIAEALGFTDEQKSVRNRSHLRRELFLSDDGEANSVNGAMALKGVVEDPSNIPSSSNQSPRDARKTMTKDISKRETRYSHIFDPDSSHQGAQPQQIQYKSQTFKNQNENHKQKSLKGQNLIHEKPKSQNYGSDRTPLLYKDENKERGIILPKVRNQPKSSFVANGRRVERFEQRMKQKTLERPIKSISCTQTNNTVTNDMAANRRQSKIKNDPISSDNSKKNLNPVSQSANSNYIDRFHQQKSTEERPYKDDQKRNISTNNNNNRSEKPGSRLNSLLIFAPETSRMSVKQQQSTNQSKTTNNQFHNVTGSVAVNTQQNLQVRQDQPLEKGAAVVSIMGRGLQTPAASNQNSSGQTPQRMIPRTGIEQPFLIEPPEHIRDTSDYERTNEISPMLKQAIIDDYKMRDSNRIINLAKTVFDIDRDSPHYKSPQDYLNNQDQIRLFKPHVNGRPIENPRLQIKNRYFKTLNPWYKLYNCSTQGKDKQMSASASKQTSSTDPTGKSEPIVDDVLLFESRFESGNLKKAIQVDKNEYELILKPDYGTKNFTQWFYFKISNTRRYREYTFHIINFVKGDSQFNDGMMPLFYSKKEEDIHGIGWYRSGYDIAYYQNNQPLCKIYGDQSGNGNGSGQSGKFTNQTASQIVGVNQKEPTNFYTLSFKFSLKHDSDEVYIAMCYPYTYTDCHRFLDSICLQPQSQTLLRRASLCKTLAGNNLEMLIITNFQSSQDHIAKRKCIILTGRVHPGESNSSYVMEGLIKFLVSNDTTAVVLRDRYVFKVVPMLNPDGVIVGNYRCSLSGHDLNRQYVNPSPKFFPECNAIKQMIRKTLECRKIDLYCDFHGHSRQKDIFMYGCNNNNSSLMPMIQERRYREQIFPMMYDRQCPYFSFNGCSFAIQKIKESCGRVVMWKEFQLINSFTCEASFCGSSQGMYKGLHFNIEMLLDMGRDFCRTLAMYSDPESGYYDQILSEIQYINESAQSNQYAHHDGAQANGGLQGSGTGKGQQKDGKVHFLIQNGLASEKNTSAALKSLQLKQKQKKAGNAIK